MINVIIPARKGSKGFPFKNRLLFKHTVETLPKNDIGYRYILTTDDDYFFDNIEKYEKENDIHFDLIKRKIRFANDTANIKDVLIDTIQQANLKEDDLIVMLYLPYPERTWKDVKEAIYLYYNLERPDSLLCKTKPKSHPYMCMQSDGENGGSQITPHDLYRRQDYPECFEISHYIFVAEARMVKHLNNNLYNDNTKFMQVNDSIDVDTLHDYNMYLEKVNG